MPAKKMFPPRAVENPFGEGREARRQRTTRDQQDRPTDRDAHAGRRRNARRDVQKVRMAAAYPRAMMSAGGSLAKKHGITVISEKVGEVRRYSIKG